MPEINNLKVKPEVPRAVSEEERHARAGGVDYAELEVTSNFSFLRSGSHPEELMAAAAEAGCRAVALTDLHTAAGLVRAHAAAIEAGITFLVGCRALVGSRSDEALRHKGTEALSEQATPSLSALVPQSLDASLFPPFPLELLLYPTTRTAYGNLCRMLTTGKRRTTKGLCDLLLDDILAAAPQMLAIVIPPEPVLLTPPFFAVAARLREAFDDDRLSLAARCLYDGHDAARLSRLAALAQQLAIPLVATNDVHYHTPDRRPLQDALTCVRLGCTIHQAGFALFANAERHIKGPAEMAHLFRDHPAAIARTVQIADRAAAFSLKQLKYEYPDEICPPGKTLMQHLTERTWQGAAERYGGMPQPAPNEVEPQSSSRAQSPVETINSVTSVNSVSSVVAISAQVQRDAQIPESVRQRLRHELQLIDELHYPAYFLTVDDIVQFARSRGILCQGRGAAANSAVCYCLGITSVDPARIDLLVERFISRERNEPPDIDIDFEHERREEVIQYIYNKYGRDRAALVAEVISYRRRSAIRDIGKALGLSLDCVDRLAKAGDWWEDDVIKEARVRELGLDPQDLTLRRAVKLAGQLIGFPRHLSQHVGGFVISRGPLCESVPIENAAMPDRTVIEWDKDDIDEMGMLKVDCLGLGMLTCIRKALDLVNEEALRHKGTKALGENITQLFLEMTDATQQSTEKADQNLSRLDCLAEGDGFDAGHLSRDDTDAARRALWSHQPDASRGSFDPIEYCGRLRTSESTGLPAFSPHSPRLPGGTDNTSGTGHEYEHDGLSSSTQIPTGGGRPRAPIPDHEPGTQARELELASPPLSALVPECLNASRLQFHTVPPEDPAVYDMLCNGDSVGVFQVESRAQMSMLPRLRPRCYYDLVIEVAIVRPGPIQGGMVHPYLRRRGRSEAVVYADERVQKVLERTLGIPLFQEQAMRLVMVAASFTAGEADQLRRAMAAWKRKEHLIERLSGKIVTGMRANGYSHAYALQVVQQIRGFSGYGFPESHAASFAHLVYVSAWLKRHHPAAFAAALINSQPMGFYQPAQIVRDAKEHGVTVLPVDVNHSGWNCRLENQAQRHSGTQALSALSSTNPLSASVPLCLSASPLALRLGMRLISRLPEAEARLIEDAVAHHGPFTSIEHLWRTTGIRVATLRALAAADAFTSLGLTRQRALWEILRLRDDDMPLFDMHEAQRHKGTEAQSDSLSASVPECLSAFPLPPIPPLTQVVHDYAATGLSLKAHPLSFARPGLAALRVTPAGELADEARFPHGTRVAVAGLVLVRQRPSTASGILFVTLEDETGIANLVVRPNIYEQHRRALRQSVALIAWGKLERAGQVVHLLVDRAQNINDLSAPPQSLSHPPPTLESLSRDFH